MGPTAAHHSIWYMELISVCAVATEESGLMNFDYDLNEILNQFH
jgi:hypothetical protein